VVQESFESEAWMLLTTVCAVLEIESGIVSTIRKNGLQIGPMFTVDTN